MVGGGQQIGMKGGGERGNPVETSVTRFSPSVAGPAAVQSHFRHGEFNIPAEPVGSLGSCVCLFLGDPAS